MGHVRGKVLDFKGKGVSGCEVRVLENGRSTRCDRKGNFVLINLPTYTFMTGNKKGFLSINRSILVKTGDNPGHLFALRPYHAGKISLTNKLIGKLSSRRKEASYGIPCAT
jgi:hypothetical protein